MVFDCRDVVDSIVGLVDEQVANGDTQDERSPAVHFQMDLDDVAQASSIEAENVNANGFDKKAIAQPSGGVEEKLNEELEIVASNAVPDPRTMMVHPIDASARSINSKVPWKRSSGYTLQREQ